MTDEIKNFASMIAPDLHYLQLDVYTKREDDWADNVKAVLRLEAKDTEIEIIVFGPDTAGALTDLFAELRENLKQSGG